MCRAWFASAREVGAHICYGIVRRVNNEELRSAPPGSSPYRICQVVVGPDGEVQCSYDKLHLCHYGEQTSVCWRCNACLVRGKTDGVVSLICLGLPGSCTDRVWQVTAQKRTISVEVIDYARSKWAV